MFLFDSFSAFLIATLAVAFAAPALALAALERPPRHPALTPVVVVAAAWAVVFAGAAVIVALGSAELEIAGLLVAAAQLALAVAIWCARGRRQSRDDGGDDGGGGSRRRVGPGGPGPGDEIDWERWETSMRDLVGHSSDAPRGRLAPCANALWRCDIRIGATRRHGVRHGRSSGSARERRSRC